MTAYHTTRMDGMVGLAAFNGDYRYDLWRIWNRDPKPIVNFIMLNPSTATAEILDPTVRRCLGYARQWGASSLVVTNLFALRSTDPKALLTYHGDPVGPENTDTILRHATTAGTVVAAWGAHQPAPARGEFVARYLRDAGVNLLCLGRTQKGYPRHPLYVRADTELVSYD